MYFEHKHKPQEYLRNSPNVINGGWWEEREKKKLTALGPSTINVF